MKKDKVIITDPVKIILNSGTAKGAALSKSLFFENTQANIDKGYLSGFFDILKKRESRADALDDDTTAQVETDIIRKIIRQKTSYSFARSATGLTEEQQNTAYVIGYCLYAFGSCFIYKNEENEEISILPPYEFAKLNDKYFITREDIKYILYKDGAIITETGKLWHIFAENIQSWVDGTKLNKNLKYGYAYGEFDFGRGLVTKLLNLQNGYNDFVSSTVDIVDASAYPVKVIKNYDGTSLTEFNNNLKRYKAIKVSGEGGVENLIGTADGTFISFVDKMLKRNIFSVASAVDLTDERNFGLSGVALKLLFNDMDIDAGQVENAVSKMLKTIYPDIKEIVWNRDLPTMEKEIVEMLSLSRGMISQKTIAENHPLVKDADAEVEAVRKEAELGNTLFE